MKCISYDNILVYRSASDLPDSWDALLPAAHPMRRSVLCLYEQTGLEHLAYLYLISGSVTEPRALACFQLLTVQPDHLNPDLLKGWQSACIPPLLRLLRPGLLIAGHLFRHDVCSFYSRPEWNDFEAYRCYKAMIERASAETRATATLVKDVPATLVHYFQNFSGQYAQLRNDISMEMHIPKEWTDFSDYEKALKHKYAQKLRKVRQGMTGVDIRELNPQQLRSQAKQLFALYAQVCRRQSFSMGMLNERFLPDLKDFYGERLRVWAFYEGEKMLAFASAWVHDEVFDMFYIGFDYQVNTDRNLYFNILYYSIEQAILSGKSQLILGRTALEAKARLGCRPRYLHTFLSVRNICLRPIVFNRIHTQHMQEGAWEQRHPLKQ